MHGRSDVNVTMVEGKRGQYFVGCQIPVAALDRHLGLGIAISVPNYQWRWSTMADMGGAAWLF